MVTLPINSTSGNQSSSRFKSKVRIASSPDVSYHMMMMMTMMTMVMMVMMMMMMMVVVVVVMMLIIMMMMIMMMRIMMMMLMIPATMFSALSILMTRRPAGLGLLINANLSSSKWYMGTVVDYGNDIVNDYGDSDSDIPSNLLGATSRLPRMSLMILLTRLSTLKSRIPY